MYFSVEVMAERVMIVTIDFVFAVFEVISFAVKLGSVAFAVHSLSRYSKAFVERIHPKAQRYRYAFVRALHRVEVGPCDQLCHDWRDFRAIVWRIERLPRARLKTEAFPPYDFERHDWLHFEAELERHHNY
jgi:hypothetical protein